MLKGQSPNCEPQSWRGAAVPQVATACKEDISEKCYSHSPPNVSYTPPLQETVQK